MIHIFINKEMFHNYRIKERPSVAELSEEREAARPSLPPGRR